MNKVFKIVFSKAKGMFVVGSEHISSHGKKSVKAAVAAAVLGVSLAGFSGSAMASGTFVPNDEGVDNSLVAEDGSITITQAKKETILFPHPFYEDAKIKVNLKENGGLETTKDGLAVKVKSGGGIVSGADGLSVDTEQITNTVIQELDGSFATEDEVSKQIENQLKEKGDKTTSIAGDTYISATQSTTIVSPDGGPHYDLALNIDELAANKTLQAAFKGEGDGNARVSAGSDAVVVTKGTTSEDGVTDYAVDLSASTRQTLSQVGENATAIKALKDVDENLQTDIDYLKDNKADKIDLKTYSLDNVELTEEDTSKGVVSKVTLTEHGVDAQGNSTSKQAGTFVDTDTRNTVTAGKNIVVETSAPKADGSVEYTVKTADDIDVKSVTTGSTVMQDGAIRVGGIDSDSGDTTTTLITGNEVKTGNTTINKDGVTTNNVKSDKVTVGDSIVFQQGNVNMGGNQIHGVAAGTEDDHAVNFAQLKATEAQLNQRIDSVDKHVDRVEDNAYAGIAMALATAGLPQSWQPGKSMIAMAAGTYMGEQGYAIGISHNTENGKWSFKATASGNSQGHFGGSVGAGYMW